MTGFRDSVEQYLESNCLPENVASKIRCLCGIDNICSFDTFHENEINIYLQSLLGIINLGYELDNLYMDDEDDKYILKKKYDEKFILKIFEELRENWDRKNKYLVGDIFGKLLTSKQTYKIFRNNPISYIPIIEFCREELDYDKNVLSGIIISDKDYRMLVTFFSENIEIIINNVKSPCEKILNFISEKNIDIIFKPSGTKHILNDVEIELLFINIKESDTNILKYILKSLEMLSDYRDNFEDIYSDEDEGIEADTFYTDRINYFCSLSKKLIAKNILKYEHVGLLFANILFYFDDEDSKYISDIIDVINESKYNIEDIINIIIDGKNIGGWKEKIIGNGINVEEVLKIDEALKDVNKIDKRLGSEIYPW